MKQKRNTMILLNVLCIPESFDTNIKLFFFWENNLCEFNSQHAHTNLNGCLVPKKTGLN